MTKEVKFLPPFKTAFQLLYEQEQKQREDLGVENGRVGAAA